MVDLRSFLSGGVIRNLSRFSGPMVVWNITGRCNLKCLHCYAHKKKRGWELNKKEILLAIDDLARLKVPIIIFSGGEPLLRRDFFGIAAYAVKQGIKVGLSTNGTLINQEAGQKIKNSGIQYAGISIDGMSACQDFFRQKKGVFEKAVAAIKHCQDAGVETGVRFTVSKHNIGDLDNILKLVEELGVKRFCLYHLVYSGKAKDLIPQDITLQQRKKAIEKMVEFSLRLKDKNVLTVDSPCDGIYLAQRFKKEGIADFYPGCSAGTRLFNIDEAGLVHPCQFWQDYTLGNIRLEKFSDIIKKRDDLLLKLRQKQDFLKGKCGRCGYKAICGGCRVRAQAVYNDAWQEDPDCFLTEKELTGDGRISALSAAQVT